MLLRKGTQVLLPCRGVLLGKLNKKLINDSHDLVGWILMNLTKINNSFEEEYGRP